MIEAYPQEIEGQMQEFYKRLPEKNKRLYGAVEALKLGYGGITYIAALFNCSRNTVQLGIDELCTEEALPQNRNRKKGGGRKATLEKSPTSMKFF
jgi:hypothetical protein